MQHLSGRAAPRLLARGQEPAIFLLHPSAGLTGPVGFPWIRTLGRTHVFRYYLGNTAFDIGEPRPGNIVSVMAAPPAIFVVDPR